MSAADTELEIGEYRVEGVLGRGAMGVVHRAFQPRLGRPVALKVLPPEFADDPDYRARFAHEAEVLARLDSPHIVQIYDHGAHEGSLYLAMQLVQGPNLAEVGVLPPARALRITDQVAQALGDGHAAGIVHRDVKPSNVLLRAEQDFAYLCDFGIAHTDRRDTAHRTGGVIGTLGYLAPERLGGAGATPASDVYSLGCLLWALLTGTPPFTGTEPEVIMGHAQAAAPRLSGADPRTRQLNDLLAAMLAKDPAARPTIPQVRSRIAGILALPGDAPVSVARRRRLPWAWVAGGAAVVAAVAIGVFLLVGDSPAERLAQAAPSGAQCSPVAVAAEFGAQEQAVCTVGAEVGELRLTALSGDPEGYLREVAGQDPRALTEGACPDGLPARTTWSGGTLLCFVVGPNTRYAWTYADLDVVAVLDGRPQVPFPQDLAAVADYFATVSP